MDVRIARLEAETHRLQLEIDKLKQALWLLDLRTQTDWFARACQVLIVITFIVAGFFWSRLGP